MWRVGGGTALAIALVLAPVAGVCALNDEYARIHTIAVVSALGDEVETNTVGLLRFGNSDYDLRTDWKLDREVVAVSEKVLAARFTIKSINVDPQTFADIKHGIFDNFWHDVGRRVSALPKENGVDAYVVVFPDPGAQLTDKRHGLLVLRGDEQSATAIASTNYLVGVFDAATGDRIDYGSAQFPTRDAVVGFATPMANCPNAMWAEKRGQLTSDQVARMGQEFAWLIDKDIGYALASANLIGKGAAADAAASSGPNPNPACREELP
jgi:hypothetical protein